MPCPPSPFLALASHDWSIIDGGKSVTVKIVDICSTCGPSDIKLATAAFTQLSPKEIGRFTGTWVVV